MHRNGYTAAGYRAGHRRRRVSVCPDTPLVTGALGLDMARPIIGPPSMSLLPSRMESAAAHCLKKPFYSYSHGHSVVAAGQPWPGDCDDAFDERFPEDYGFPHRIGGGHVLDYGSGGYWQGSRLHLASGYGFDELLFSALRVFDRERAYCDAVASIQSERVDGVGLVGLDSDSGGLLRRLS